MKKLVSFLMAVGFLAIFSTANAAPTGWDWTWEDPTGEVHYYYLNETANITWNQADTAVGNLNAAYGEDIYYLASITSRSEQEAMIEGLNTFFGYDEGVHLGKDNDGKYVEKMTEFWLGGVQIDKTAEAGEGWSWSGTDEAFCYTCWAKDEPNDRPYDNNDSEFELATWNLYFIQGKDDERWRWNDEVKYSNLEGFISEIGADYDPYNGTCPVPEPGTMILFGLGLLGLAGVNRKKA